ncbi:MAG TPA: 5-oxoprolinase subunit PxpB [Chthoniobacterales bacterium]|nr:5-oxoprolinase subunit PxpB [Chthoniobacterales bacterium]
MDRDSLSVEITPLGDSALLARFASGRLPDEVDQVAKVSAAAAAVAAARIPGVVDVAPAYESIAVFFEPRLVLQSGDPANGTVALREQITSAIGTAAGSPGRAGRTMEVQVCYDAHFADDLDAVAQHTGLAPEDVIRRHSAAEYRVACIGFVPGFPFLIGLPPELATPRRATPRTRVPAGSVAIGGTQTGIYPRDSPGGWNIIGRTPLQLFDVHRVSPSLLATGDVVRFRTISREEFDALAR